MAAEAHLAGLISRPGVRNGRELLSTQAATKATLPVNAKQRKKRAYFVIGIGNAG